MDQFGLKVVPLSIAICTRLYLVSCMSIVFDCVYFLDCWDLAMEWSLWPFNLKINSWLVKFEAFETGHWTTKVLMAGWDPNLSCQMQPFQDSSGHDILFLWV